MGGGGKGTGTFVYCMLRFPYNVLLDSTLPETPVEFRLVCEVPLARCSANVKLPVVKQPAKAVIAAEMDE